MAFSAGEVRAQEGANDFAGKFGADDPGAQAQHVHRVVFHALSGGKRVVAHRGTDAGNLVRRHAYTHAAAAHNNAALRPAAAHRLGNGHGVVGIVVGGDQRFRATILDGMARKLHLLDHMIFQWEAGVVATYSDVHLVFETSGKNLPCTTLFVSRHLNLPHDLGGGKLRAIVSETPQLEPL